MHDKTTNEEVILAELYKRVGKARELASEYSSVLDGRVIDGLNDIADVLEQQLLSVRKPTTVTEIRTYDSELWGPGLVYLIDEFIHSPRAEFLGRSLDDTQLDGIRDFFWRGNAEVVIVNTKIETVSQLMDWLLQHLFRILHSQ